MSNYTQQALHDGLSEMIESGRLTEADIPNDYHWLVHILEKLANQQDATRQFGDYVLRTMESTEEWNADMLDDLARTALEFGLSELDERGYFLGS